MTLFISDEKIAALKSSVSNSYVWTFGREAGRKGKDPEEAYKNDAGGDPDMVVADNLFFAGYLRGFEERKAALGPWVTKSREEIFEHLRQHKDMKPTFLLFLEGYGTTEQIIEDYPYLFWSEVFDQVESYD